MRFHQLATIGAVNVILLHTTCVMSSCSRFATININNVDGWKNVPAGKIKSVYSWGASDQQIVVNGYKGSKLSLQQLWDNREKWSFADDCQAEEHSNDILEQIGEWNSMLDEENVDLSELEDVDMSTLEFVGLVRCDPYFVEKLVDHYLLRQNRLMQTDPEFKEYFEEQNKLEQLLRIRGGPLNGTHNLYYAKVDILPVDVLQRIMEHIGIRSVTKPPMNSDLECIFTMVRTDPDYDELRDQVKTYLESGKKAGKPILAPYLAAVMVADHQFHRFMQQDLKEQYEIIKNAVSVKPGSEADKVLFGLGTELCSLYPLVRREEVIFLNDLSTMNIENPEHRRRALKFLSAKSFHGSVQVIEWLKQEEVPANSLWRCNDSDGSYLAGDVIGRGNRFSVSDIRTALAKSVDMKGQHTYLAGCFTWEPDCKLNMYRNILNDMEEQREKLPHSCQMMEDIVMAMLRFIYKGKTGDFQKGIDKYAEEFLPKRTAFKKSVF